MRFTPVSKRHLALEGIEALLLVLRAQSISKNNMVARRNNAANAAQLAGYMVVCRIPLSGSCCQNTLSGEEATLVHFIKILMTRLLSFVPLRILTLRRVYSGSVNICFSLLSGLFFQVLTILRRTRPLV